jgi:putative transposase
LLLSDAERKTLAEIGYRLGRKTLEDVANAAKPDTILGWYKKLVAQKFDGSKARRKVGRPQVDDDIEQLIVRMPGRIAAGAMTGSWAPWPILATGFLIRL